MRNEEKEIVINHLLIVIDLTWTDVITVSLSTVFQYALTFVSRTVLTITVSHPLFTLQVYGTARIRVLC